MRGRRPSRLARPGRWVPIRVLRVPQATGDGVTTSLASPLPLPHPLGSRRSLPNSTRLSQHPRSKLMHPPWSSALGSGGCAARTLARRECVSPAGEGVGFGKVPGASLCSGEVAPRRRVGWSLRASRSTKNRPEAGLCARGGRGGKAKSGEHASGLSAPWAPAAPHTPALGRSARARDPGALPGRHRCKAERGAAAPSPAHEGQEPFNSFLPEGCEILPAEGGGWSGGE